MHHLPPLSEETSADSTDEEKMAEDRFDEYCKDWLCQDYIDAPAEVDALVAWRPVDVDTYVPYESTEQVNEEDKEYLVKWKGLSYFRVFWNSGSWVWGVTITAMRKAFARRNNYSNLPKMTTEDAIPEDFLRIDIVFEVKYKNQAKTSEEMIDLGLVREVDEARVKFKGLSYEDVVWEQPPDPEDGERWTEWEEAYTDFINGRHIRPPNPLTLKTYLAKVKSQDFESDIMMKAQPESLTSGELMKYQMDGLNWLLYHWYSGQNAILADEMGLGKTIQVIGFMTTLQQVHQCWPFLVVVPNATVVNWRREIKQWAPSLRVVTYFGSAEARRITLKREMFPRGKAADCSQMHRNGRQRIVFLIENGYDYVGIHTSRTSGKKRQTEMSV
jgi:chromodomain-helicase-DNA-binding protein 4